VVAVEGRFEACFVAARHLRAWCNNFLGGAIMSAAETTGRETTTKHLWCVDWRETFPRTVDDLVLDVGTFSADAQPFIEAHYGSAFGEGAGAAFLAEPMTPAKQRYCEDMDVFVYRHQGRSVGIFMGHPLDWSTYYFRSAVVLPDYRGLHLVHVVQTVVGDRLRAAGVARMECEVSVANAKMLRVQTAGGWIITSMLDSERWGAMVRMTRFLSEDAERVFRRQFGAGDFRPAAPKTNERT